MPSNIREFEAGLDRWMDREVPDALERTHRTVLLDLFARLVRATPVDTGRARANWQIAHGSPPSGEIAWEGGGGGAASREALDRESPVALSAPAPGRSWVANNVPYIGRLNDGWSDQAPAGFVDLAIEETKSALD